MLWSRRSRTAAVALVFGLVTLPLSAQQPDETLPGFAPNSVVQAGTVDNVNLYSGDPGVVIPLGPEYPLGPGVSWSLKAQYSSKIWRFNEDPCLGNDYRHAMITGYPTIGVGWTLTLGSVGPGDFEDPFALYYYSPDGGRHGVAAGGGVTGPDTRLRITPIALGYKVEFPDGTVQFFEHRFKAPRPTTGTSPDFADRPFGVTPSERYGLARIESAFGETLLSVNWVANYPSVDSWKVSQVLLRPGLSQARTIDFVWTTDQITVGGPTWQVLDYIDFPATDNPAGTGRKLRVDFTLEDYVFDRNTYDNSSGAPTACRTGSSPQVPKLAKITLSDPGASPTFTSVDYNFTYLPNTQFSIANGVLTKVELPTKGTIAYEYAITVAGLGDPATAETGCGSPALYEPAGTPLPHQQYWDKSPAVIKRTAFDPVTNLTGETFYERSQFAPRIPPANVDPDTFRVTRRVIVRAPSGNGIGQVVTRHLFHTEIVSFGTAGIELQRRSYAPDQSECTAPIRTLVFCYESPGNPVRCGFHDPSVPPPLGPYLRYNIGIPQHQAEVTWFAANPASASGACDVSSPSCKKVARTTFTSSLLYATETVTTSLTGIPGWSSRSTTTNWTPEIGSPPSGKWILDRFTSKSVTDAGGGLPTNVTTSYTFEPSGAFLEQVSLADGSNGTLTTTFTKGTVAGEKGAPIQRQMVGSSGLTGTFTDTQTFENGRLATKARSPFTWKTFDVDRDDRTGLVTASRDPNGKTTTYAYDSLGRLKETLPPDGELAAGVCYYNATLTEPASTLVKKGGVVCFADDGVPGDGSGSFEGYQYDGFGRVVREMRRFPHVTFSTNSTYYSRRETRYDAAGHRIYLSEWFACKKDPAFSTTDIRNCLRPVGPLPVNPNPGTYYSNFDPFGRPQTITAADGSITTYDFTDGTISFSDTVESVTRKVKNGPSETNAVTVTRRDVLGRTVKVTEPGGDATDYVYNALDKLTSVTQGTQPPREFTYDKFGFLRSEKHPELVSIAATYSSYNALGNPGSKVEGGITSNFTYDELGRVTKVQAGGQVYLRNCWDGQNPCVDSVAGYTGAVNPKGNLTRRYGYNPLDTSAATVMDDFTYSGMGGRLSKKEMKLTGSPYATLPTVTETWTYHVLGLVSTHGLPFVGTSPDIVTTMSYSSGFPKGLSAGASVVTDATYSPAGVVKSWTAQNGVVTTITPDTFGIPRPSSIGTSGVAGGANFSTGAYAYDGSSNITGIGADTFIYDLRSRLLQVNISGQPQQSYSYDRWGNLGSASSSTNRLTAGLYDARGNLTHLDAQKVATYDDLSRQIRYDGLPERYLYDGSGERIAVVPPAKAKFYTIAPCRIFDSREPAFNPALSPGVSRVLGVRGAGGVNNACASPNGVPNDVTITAVSGNLTATGSTQAGSLRLMPEGSGSSVITLNYAANQTRANNFNLGLSTDGKLTITLFGTAAGHGIVDLNGYYKNDGAIGSQAWRLTLRDDSNRLATEYAVTSTAARLKNYFYFGNLLVATRDSAGAFMYFHSDHLGTPRLVTNSAAQKVEEHKYFPYGQPLTPGLGSQPHKLAAMEQDATSGFFFDHARFLGNGMAAGRFLSPDPAYGNPSSPQGWNRYVYASNNPLRFVDVDGENPVVAWTAHRLNHLRGHIFRGAEEAGKSYFRQGIRFRTAQRAVERTVRDRYLAGRQADGRLIYQRIKEGIGLHGENRITVITKPIGGGREVPVTVMFDQVDPTRLDLKHLITPVAIALFESAVDLAGELADEFREGKEEGAIGQHTAQIDGSDQLINDTEFCLSVACTRFFAAPPPR